MAPVNSGNKTFLHGTPLVAAAKKYYFTLAINSYNVLTLMTTEGIEVNSFIKHQSCNHIEISQLVCRGNQLTGFFKIGTLTFNELICWNFTA